VDHGQGPGVLEVGERLADGDLGDAGDGDDLAGAHLLRGDPLELLGDEQLGDLGLLRGAVRPTPGDAVALVEVAVHDAAEGDAPEVRRRVQVGHEGLERRVRLVLGRRDALEQQVEQRLEGGPVRQAGAVGRAVERRLALAGHAVDDREVELLERRVEVEEQLLDLVHHLGDASVGPVDLVDHEHDRQVGLQRLAEHEARLGQRSLGGVHEEQHTVDHRQAALHLPTEVGVARRVDDVDLHVAVGHGGVLGEDGDPLLPLEVHGVHDALVDVLVGAKGAGLPEHLVDEGGLAVVDVGHDGHVAEVGASRHREVLRGVRGGRPAYGGPFTRAASSRRGRRPGGRLRRRPTPRC
jgi:hypothetical protein